MLQRLAPAELGAIALASVGRLQAAWPPDRAQVRARRSSGTESAFIARAAVATMATGHTLTAVRETIMPGRHTAHLLRSVAAIGLQLCAAGCLSSCGRYDPVDPLGMQKSFNPDYKAAYEANQAAPHIYDRPPTPAERDQVRIACHSYVEQQKIATVGNIVGGAISPTAPGADYVLQTE